jgi:tetratricopeptide (TPR) repeat protein
VGALKRFARVTLVSLATWALCVITGDAQPQPNGCPAKDGWPALVSTYLSGDAVRLVERLATCSVRDVAGLQKPQVPDNDLRTGEAIALLATEAGFWNTQFRASLAFSDVAWQLMLHGVCSTDQMSQRRLRFCLRWYLLLVPSLNRSKIDETDRFLPNQAEAQLARGIWGEFWMGPRVETSALDGVSFPAAQPDTAFVATSHGEFSDSTADLAIDSFRKAVALDPNLAEAHLRLGRVLWLLDRKEQAIAALDAALAAAKVVPDQFSEYVAHLMLAQIAEAQHRVSDALDHYTRAEAVGPRFSSAAIGHARLLTDTGDAAAARVVLRRFFARVAGQPSVIDPWAVYPRGRTFHYRVEAMKALRAELRGNE